MLIKPKGAPGAPFCFAAGSAAAYRFMAAMNSALSLVPRSFSSRNSMLSTGESGDRSFRRIQIRLSSSGGQQQLFLPGAGAVDVDGREDALLRQLPVQMNLHVAGALEFLEDDLVHAAAGINQGGGDDGEAAPFLDVPGGPEKPFGPLQGVGIQRRRRESCRWPAPPCCRPGPGG